jgi:carbon monoxide dehydrogenase subunit G
VITNTSKVANVTMTNRLAVPLTGISIAASGAPFSQTNNCPSSLAVNAQCKITITFSPTAIGTQSGTVTVTDSAPTSPQSIVLKGSGVTPTSLIPLNLHFGVVPVGTQSSPMVTTVTNNATTAITFSGIVITGAQHADFSQTNTCSGGLAANAKCTVTVTFTPNATGTRLANVVLTDSGIDSPQNIALFGTGH